MDLSIIIPTRDRPRQLAECLEALACLDGRLPTFEVIVVDDGSRSSLELVLDRFRDRLPLSLHVQRPSGPAAARNAGAERASGAYLAFTDDDCAPAADWAWKLMARCREAEDCIVGGRTVNALTTNAYATASQDLISYLYAHFNGDEGNARFLASNNMAVPARSFRALGGFDESFPKAAAEDRDLCDRWLHSGRRMAYAPEAVVYHRHQLSPLSFWRQHFNYGRGAYRYQQLRRDRSGERQQFEPWSFYLGMARQPFRCERAHDSPLRASLLMVSQAANCAGFGWEQLVARARRR